jgi:hypothetical protein
MRMHPRARLLLAGLVLLTIAGCGGAPEPEGQPDAKKHGRETDETVFDDMIKTQDRARAVEDVTMKAKAATDAAIAQSEGESQDQQH